MCISSFQLSSKSLHNTATAPAGQLEKLAGNGRLGSPGSTTPANAAEIEHTHTTLQRNQQKN